MGRPGRRKETVRTSLDAAHGQTASGRSPLLVKTAKNWSHDESDQGLAPSATSSIRSDERLISRWSRVASRPQCKSRDLTTARLAVSNTSIRILMYLYQKFM